MGSSDSSVRSALSVNGSWLLLNLRSLFWSSDLPLMLQFPLFAFDPQSNTLHYSRIYISPDQICKGKSFMLQSSVLYLQFKAHLCLGCVNIRLCQC